jgi:preprotein translocase subunit SecF
MTTTASRTQSRDERPLGRNGVMRLYRGQTNFDFINRWRYWFALSGTIIAIGLVALGVRGLNFSIDFKGGVVWQVPTNASVADVKADLATVEPQLISQATLTQLVNRSTGQKSIEVQAPGDITGKTAEIDAVTDELAKIAGVSNNEVSLTAVGPSWGSDVTNKAIEAVVVFLVLISISIAVYFETKMAIAALVALLHDMLVTIGIYALSGFQVSPDTVIAFLTVLGYSLYDTIVVFDKVKENTRGLASTNRVTYTDVVNLSMNQVLARSVNTSFVAVMPVFCILVVGSWILGASSLNDFGLALFIGLLSGAYSSIFIASPILALLKEREPRYVEIRRRLAAYPQSRAVLTPSTVADGALVGGAKATAVSSVARPLTAGPSSAGPSSAGAVSSRASAPRRSAVVTPDEVVPGEDVPVDAGAEVAAADGLVRATNGGNGADGGAAAAATAATAGAVAAVGADPPRDVARGASSQPGAGNGKPQAGGARKVPPRPRKKTPRRR